MAALLDRQQSSSMPNVVSRCLLFGCKVAELPGSAAITLEDVVASCKRVEESRCVHDTRHTDELGALSLKMIRTQKIQPSS